MESVCDHGNGTLFWNNRWSDQLRKFQLLEEKSAQCRDEDDPRLRRTMNGQDGLYMRVTCVTSCPTEVFWAWHDRVASLFPRWRITPFVAGQNQSSYFHYFLFSFFIFICLFLSLSTLIWHFDTFILRPTASYPDWRFSWYFCVPSSCVRTWLGKTA
jgi:hypothetical protein